MTDENKTDDSNKNEHQTLEFEGFAQFEIEKEEYEKSAPRPLDFPNEAEQSVPLFHNEQVGDAPAEFHEDSHEIDDESFIAPQKDVTKNFTSTVLTSLKGKLSPEKIKSWYQKKLKEAENNEGTLTNKLATLPKSFSLERLILKIFSPDSRPKVHNIFIIISVILFCIILGRVLPQIFFSEAKMIKDLKINVNPSVSNKQINTTILNSSELHLFNASKKNQEEKKIAEEQKKEIVTPKQSGPLLCDESTQISRLPLKLKNTITLQNSKKSLAVIEPRGEGVLSFREGDVINNLGKIKKITGTRVILENFSTNGCEYLEVEDIPSYAKEKGPSKLNIVTSEEGQKIINNMKPIEGMMNEGNNYTLTGKLRDKLLDDMENIRQQALATPQKNPDGSLSIILTEIEAGSIYSNLDIQNGDVLDSINGEKIYNINELLNLYGKIEEVQSIEFGFKRDGESIVKNLNIKDL